MPEASRQTETPPTDPAPAAAPEQQAQGSQGQAEPPAAQAFDPAWFALVGLLLVAIALLVVLLRRSRKQALPPSAEKEALENKLEKETSRRKLAEAELEAELRRHDEATRRQLDEAAQREEQARRKAEYDEQKRLERERRQAESPAEREARLAREEEAKRREKAATKEEEAERRRLRAEEEARKKAEYQARKEAERAERERRAREQAEAEAARQRALEEEARLREEARLQEEERRRRKIEAEAGKTLAEGLSRTREGGFVARLAGLFGKGGAAVSEQSIGELEEILFTADIGVGTSMRLVERAQERLRRNELSDASKLRGAIRSDIEGILDEATKADPRPAAPGLGLPLGEARPWVIMVVGVNGAGKTTTIGKLAAKLKARGMSVLLAAGDTFRAAATEQLDVWAERAEVPIVKGAEGADPGSVLFEAVQRAGREGIDVVLCDTAGRLHTKAPLMEELKKAKRVMGKAQAGAPHEVLLVLDATMGQNAIQQARQFHEALGVTSIALTKLDGTAKGGVVIGISDELKIPVRLVGIGESLADLRPFDPHEFVTALFGD